MLSKESPLKCVYRDHLFSIEEMLERQERSDAKVARDGVVDRGNSRRKNVVIVDEQPAQRQGGGGCCGGGGGGS